MDSAIHLLNNWNQVSSTLGCRGLIVSWDVRASCRKRVFATIINYLESMPVQDALTKLNFKTGKGTAKEKETGAVFRVPPARFCSFTQLT